MASISIDLVENREQVSECTAASQVNRSELCRTVRIDQSEPMKAEVPPSVPGNGIDVVRQFDTVFGVYPGATISVHGAVKYRATFRTDEMGVTGAFAPFAVFDAIISHGSPQFRRCPLDA